MRQTRLRAFDFGEQFGFIRDEFARAFERRQKLLRGKIGGAAEAAVQMRRLDRDTKEAEIGEIGIEARFRMPREKARAQASRSSSSLDPFGAADNREARMRQRIAAARRIEGRIEKQGKPRIGVKMPRMRGEPRQQKNRTSIRRGRDIDERGEGRGRRRSHRGERRGPCRAQEQLGFGDGVEFRLQMSVFHLSSGHRFDLCPL